MDMTTGGRQYIKHNGKDCPGASCLRDFSGSPTECMAKCDELKCTHFVRVNKNENPALNGKCFFRAGSLQQTSQTHDDRDCYEAKSGVHEKKVAHLHT